MNAPPLTMEEFIRVRDALKGVHVGVRTPRYFQRFVVARLRESCLELAEKVRRLAAADVDELRRWLQEWQDLT
jgi:hypothetical protein